MRRILRGEKSQKKGFFYGRETSRPHTKSRALGRIPAPSAGGTTQPELRGKLKEKKAKPKNPTPKNSTHGFATAPRGRARPSAAFPPWILGLARGQGLARPLSVPRATAVSPACAAWHSSERPASCLYCPGKPRNGHSPPPPRPALGQPCCALGCPRGQGHREGHPATGGMSPVPQPGLGEGSSVHGQTDRQTDRQTSFSSTRGEGKHIPVRSFVPQQDGRTDRQRFPGAASAQHLQAELSTGCQRHGVSCAATADPRSLSSSGAPRAVPADPGIGNGPGAPPCRGEGAGSGPGVCPVLLVVELQLDLVADLVDEEPRQDDAY